MELTLLTSPSTTITNILHSCKGNIFLLTSENLWWIIIEGLNEIIYWRIWGSLLINSNHWILWLCSWCDQTLMDNCQFPASGRVSLPLVTLPPPPVWELLPTNLLTLGSKISEKHSWVFSDSASGASQWRPTSNNYITLNISWQAWKIPN